MDNRFRNMGVAVLMVIAATWLPPGPVSATRWSLEGAWQLQEQTYGRGEANLANTGNPLMMEFTAGVDGLLGRVWVEGEEESSYPWPSFVADHGPLPVQVLERWTGLEGTSVMVRYLVRQSEDDDLVLDIQESYEIGESGETLDGTMTVTFTVDGDDRGSYVLHRHFRRVSP